MSEDRKQLGAVFDAHTDAEFKARDIEATMATMSGWLLEDGLADASLCRLLRLGRRADFRAPHQERKA
jgi:hypothetical protein